MSFAIDTLRPRVVADFWCNVLGGQVIEEEDGGISIAEPCQTRGLNAGGRNGTRLVGPILLDMHHEWVSAERRYLPNAPWPGSTTSDTDDIAVLESGE